MERKGLWYLILRSPSFPLLSSPLFPFFGYRWIKNIDMSNNFPRKRGKPADESILILNVTNLPQERLMVCCLGFWYGICERTLRILGQSWDLVLSSAVGLKSAHACPIAASALQVAGL